MSGDDLGRRVAETRPFRGMLSIERLERLPGWKGGRATAFLLTARDGRSFKLRVCESRARARRIAGWIARAPQVFPRLEGRDGRHLLLEWLTGHRILGEASLPGHCRGLGRLYGGIHAGERGFHPGDLLASRIASRRAHRRFERELAFLRKEGVLEEGRARRIAERFAAGLRSHGLPACLELRDLHAGNVMVDEGGDLRFVDEEGIAFAVRGLGQAKLLAQVTDRSCHREFREGYAEVMGPDFLTPEYARFLALVDSVHSVESKVRRGAERGKLERSLEALHRAADGS